MNDNESLKNEISKAITNMWDKILRDSEVLSDSQYRFKRYRSHVLDYGNDTIRDLHNRIDEAYVISKNYKGLDKVDINEEE